MMTTTQRLLPAALLAAVAGCVDLAPAPPPPVHYYTLPQLEGRSVPPAGTVPLLDLARVDVAPSIDDRLVQRVAPHELRYVDTARFADGPEALAARALEDALFRSGAFRRAAAGAPRVDVELMAFEEVLGTPHVARVAFAVLVTGADGNVALDRTFEARERIAGEGAGAAAKALTRALRAAADQIADHIGGR